MSLPKKKQDKTKIVQIWGDILDDGFTSVPNILLKYRNNLKIKPQHLALIIDIMSFKWDRENPYPSYSTLAQRAGVAERSIKRMTQDLEELELLIRTPRFDKNTGAQITTVFDFRPLIEKLSGEKEEKYKTNLLIREGDKYVTGGVTDMSPGGVTDMSPKKYTYINKTNIKKSNSVKKKNNTVQKHIKNGIFRKRIFEIFDNLYEEVSADSLVYEGAYKTCSEILTNRKNELLDIRQKVDLSQIAETVRKKFPYEQFPSNLADARKFFVANVCNITVKELLSYI